MLALFFFSKRGGAPSGGRGASSRPLASATGAGKPLVRTGEDDVLEWGRRRLALLLFSMGALEPPLTGPLADRVALSLLAQWAHETNRGKSEFNFNLGGWMARTGDDFHAAADRLSGAGAFRWTAYPDLPSAVEDQLRRLIVSYPAAWSALVASPESPTWIEELGRRGYYTAPIADYSKAWIWQRSALGSLLP